MAAAGTCEQPWAPDVLAAVLDVEDPQQALDEVDPWMIEWLYEALDRMPYRIRRVLEMRYGLRGECEHTLDEAARVFNISRERVRQIEQKACADLLVTFHWGRPPWEPLARWELEKVRRARAEA